MKKSKDTKQYIRKWHLVDATGIRLGHLASTIAPILQGKNKPDYLPNVDRGDYVIVINCKDVDVHPARIGRKKYYHHTGYPGGIKEMPIERMLKEKPEEMIKIAVWGMMPKTKLGKVMFKKLFVYAGSEHKHEAQKPVELQIKTQDSRLKSQN